MVNSDRAAADDADQKVFTVFQFSVMKRRGLILLLLSGCVMVCHPQPGQFIREFHYINEQKSWSDAQQYCRDSYDDIAIINSSAYIQEAQREVGGTEVWIGLLMSWTWSQTNQALSSLFTNWAPTQPGPGKYVSLSGFGFWSARQSSDIFFFICYSNVTNRHILVQTSLTWSQAQSYCRNHYTDLSTISSSQDNSETTSLLPQNWDAWIGLYRHDWMWSDWSKASNLPWAVGQPDGSGNCVTMDTSGLLHSHNCIDQYSFLCYKDTKQSASRSVKVRLTAGSADLNDPTVQESLLQQVREKLAEQGITEQVMLRWKKQPDGKVFHKEKEKAPPSNRDCGTV